MRLTFRSEDWISVPERNRRHYLERLQTGSDEAMPSSDNARYDGFRSYQSTRLTGGGGVVGRKWAKTEGRK